MRHIENFTKVVENLLDAEKRGFIKYLNFESQPHIDPRIKIMTFCVFNNIEKAQDLTIYLQHELQDPYLRIDILDIDCGCGEVGKQIKVLTPYPLLDILELLNRRGIPFDSELGQKTYKIACEKL